jgi:hypothetical protein
VRIGKDRGLDRAKSIKVKSSVRNRDVSVSTDRGRVRTTFDAGLLSSKYPNPSAAVSLPMRTTGRERESGRGERLCRERGGRRKIGRERERGENNIRWQIIIILDGG